MKAEEFGFIALRLLALWYILTAIFGLAVSASFFLTEPGGAIAGSAQLIFSLVTLAIAGYVFVNTRKVARVFFSSVEEAEVTASGRTLQTVGLTVVGAYLAASALPGLFANLVELLWVLRDGAVVEREGFFAGETVTEVAYDGSMFVVGAFLFVKATWLVSRWTQLQAPVETSGHG